MAKPQPRPQPPQLAPVPTSETPDDVVTLKLALWFISKCDSLEEAERAFRAAVAAVRELRS
jgi:hypothetical protein